MTDSTGERIYKPLSRLYQKQFPDRKTIVRPSARSSASKGQQTTLTQIDFCPSSTSLSVVKSDSEDDYTEPRPKKKRKKRGDLRRQTTLTQLPWSSGQPSLGSISPILNSEEIIQETQCDSHEACDLPRSSYGPLDSEDETRQATTRLYAAASKQDSPTDGSRDSDPGSPAVISTPLRTIKPEIPSSNTPQSLQFDGTKPDRHLRSPTKSPLLERSINISTSPVIDSPVPENADHSDHEESPSRPVMRPDFVFRKPEIPERRLCSQHNHIPPSYSADHEMLHTRTVILDSQADELGETLPLEDHVDSTYIPGTELEQHGNTCRLQSSVTDMTQATYDPARSALDRDAARFMFSQSFLPPAEEDFRNRGNTSPQPCKREQLHKDDTDNDALVEPQSSPRMPLSKTETIDLTDSSQQRHTPTSSASSHIQAEERPQHKTRHGAISPSRYRSSQATTVAGTQSAVPSPSRVPQTMQPAANQQSEKRRFPDVSSSPNFATSPHCTQGTRRSSFSLYTNDTTYLPHSSQFEVRDFALISDSENDLDLPPDNEEDDRDLPEPVQNKIQLVETEDGDLDPKTRARRVNGKDRKGRRLKRAQEVLPDSLLDYSLPAAPAWTSSPPVAGTADEVEMQDANVTSNGWTGDDVQHEPQPPSLKRPQDYSLPPPSSDWRSSGRLRSSD